jgi:hypothetical protein
MIQLDFENVSRELRYMGWDFEHVKAVMKSDSTWPGNEAVDDPRSILNLRVVKIQFVVKSITLNKK